MDWQSETWALRHSALFTGMRDCEVRDILERGDEQWYRAGHRVVLQGLRGSDFFMVVDGLAGVDIDGSLVSVLQAGDCFGEIAVLQGGTRIASVQALTPLRCICLPNGELERMLRRHPRLALNLLHVMAARLSHNGVPDCPAPAPAAA